jgi:dolichol-phosphate mannosyltransferase
MVLLVIQLPATAILLSRLLRGPFRRPALNPQNAQPQQLGCVSIVVPTLNEAERITPCLEGLSRQGYEVREITIVDSRSHDGTPDLVKLAQHNDPRFRLITDDPLPAGWVGRPWALHTGFLQSSEQSQWVLGIDADTYPQPGLVASLIQTAEAENYDLVSLAPQFVLKQPGECWLQPALLMTLIYRFGAAGDTTAASERVMANGQCFLCRRSVLAGLGGYQVASNSFCDDVTLARYAASQGAKVGFLDGTRVLKVRMYEGTKETWREWGRSLDLKDAAFPQQIWGDLGFLIAVQGLPLPMLGLLVLQGRPDSLIAWLTVGLNLGLCLIRLGMTAAIRPAYDLSQASGLAKLAFGLSPLADLLAVLRILLSSSQQPKVWRGRSYAKHLLTEL